MKRAIPLLVFVVIVVFLGIGLTLDPREVPSPFIGKPAPAFRLPELGAPERTLDIAALKGQVVVLNVWASWCVSCRQEHPVLLDLTRRAGVAVWGLNYKDEREAAQRWLMRHGGDPYVASGFDAEGKTGMDWGVYGVPETFVIDRKGVIRKKFTGPLTPESVATELLPLIQELQKEAT